jgi:hypothetical protein
MPSRFDVDLTKLAHTSGIFDCRPATSERSIGERFRESSPSLEKVSRKSEALGGKAGNLKFEVKF